MAPQQYGSMPFWDFIHSLDPNHAANAAYGAGVDRSEPSSQQFPSGFPFGPAAGPPPPPPPEFAGAGWWAGPGGPWGGRGGFGGRGRGGRGGRGGWGRHGGHHNHPSGDEGRNENEQEKAQEDVAAEHSDSLLDDDMEIINEKGESPETMRDDVPDPEEVAPEEDDQPRGPHGRGGRRGQGRGGRGGRCGRNAREAGRHPFGPRGRHFHGPPPPYSGAGGPPFDFGGMMRGFASHPFFQNLREQVENYRSGAQNNGTGDIESFAPPVDIFSTERAFVLHVALPGAKKEDVGVNWDADRNVLNIAGVIHRPGDEEFLQTLTSGERKVGLFERSVPLPPAGAQENEEIDGMGITARMEDGVLIITVPKAEKEWTEIRKVDIE